ncbi:hypothetical protein [Paraburkholderia adhaesiva]|uniref:hypothetical protein n=1 Tax=Paraburkholderia adhaesiva TaxID=2883244 RepID=UPI001F40A205|nr:hypothetical protein [Paraburkholderia adhaesiva]
MKRQKSAAADLPGTWIDQPGETEESHDAKRASNQEHCQHDASVTKRNKMYRQFNRIFQLSTAGKRHPAGVQAQYFALRK